MPLQKCSGTSLLIDGVQGTEHHHWTKHHQFRKKYRRKMMEPVEQQGWEGIMPLPTSMYSNLVILFYCNLEVGTPDNEELTIDSRVR